jgi:hypothetical protein
VIPWFRRHLRIEDVLVFGWLILQPILLPGPSASGPDKPDLFFGLADLVALLGMAACIGARSRPGVVSGLVADGTVLYAVGPLFGAFAFTVDDTNANLGLGSDLAILPLVLAIGAVILARVAVAPLSAPARRALVTPFVIVTSRFFGSVLSGLVGIFDLRQLLSSPPAPGGFSPWFVLGFGIVGAAVFYVMLVFAPRQVAEREGTPRTWLIRFGVFVIGLVIGQTLAGLVRPV